MRLEDIVEKKIELNTEEVLILKKSELINIKDFKMIEEFENMYESIANMLKYYIEFVFERDDFLVAVYKYQRPNNTYTWFPYLLYEYYGELYRIQKQFYQCDRCNNIYDVGNVSDPMMFVTVADSEYKKVMSRVKKLPKAKCPYCGEVVSRFWVIWADDKKQNE